MNSRLGPILLILVVVLGVIGLRTYFGGEPAPESVESVAQPGDDSSRGVEPSLLGEPVRSTKSSETVGTPAEKLAASEPSEVLRSDTGGLPLDPEKKKYITEAKLGDAAKRILLAGAALHANLREISQAEQMRLRHELNKDLYRNRDEFRVDVRTFMKDEKAHSLEIREDVLHVASQMNPIEDREMQQYAEKQFQEYLSRNQVFVGPDRDKLIDSMVVMAITAKDPQQGIKKIEGMIQPNDPNQMAALMNVRAIIQFKTTTPPDPERKARAQGLSP